MARFERKDAARLAGGAHVGRRVHVRAARGDGACTRSGRNTGSGSRWGAPRQTPRKWRSPGAVVHDGRERPSRRRAERDALHACAGGSRSRRYISRSRQHQLDRTAHRRARRARRASTCGQVRSAEPNAPPTKGEMTRMCLGRDAEHGGDLVRHVDDPLASCPRASGGRRPTPRWWRASRSGCGFRAGSRRSGRPSPGALASAPSGSPRACPAACFPGRSPAPSGRPARRPGGSPRR